MQTRRYLFKLYPTPAQASILHEQRKMMADLWNALKQRREDVYRREGKSLSFFDLTNEITTLRHECPEWAVVPAVTAHRVAKHLTESYQAFFRRLKAGEAPGYPRWRRRETATTIPLGTMCKTGWYFERRDDNPFSWRLHYKSVTDVRDRTTWIHARGRIPAHSERRLGDDSESVRLLRARGSAAISSWRNADIIWRDKYWWLSICVDIEPRRQPGRFPTTISFDLLDGFALVNGITETPEELIDALALQTDVDRLKSDRDLEFPRGKKLSDDERERLGWANDEIAALSATVARKRRNALHVWSCRVVSRASDLTIVAPPVRQVTKTPRGDEKQWGAQVETVSGLNRNILSQAPAAAVQMLQYKAQEAGIRVDIITDNNPKIAVGGDLVSAGKQLRRQRREARKAA